NPNYEFAEHVGRQPFRRGEDVERICCVAAGDNKHNSAKAASALPPRGGIHSEVNHATTGCMGDRVCTLDRLETVRQSTYMELGRVNRYAKTAKLPRGKPPSSPFRRARLSKSL